MKNFKEIIEEIKSFKSKDFKPSDDAILECSTMIYISEKEQSPKSDKTPAKQGKKKDFKIKDPTSPATQPQKDKLDEMGIKYPEELTKGEAHQLISENSSKKDYADY